MTYLNKYPIPDNFYFSSPSISSEFFEESILKITVNRLKNPLPNHSVFVPQLRPLKKSTAPKRHDGYLYTITTAPFSFSLSYNGVPMIDSGTSFIGMCGTKILFRFHKTHRAMPFWGLGEKMGAFEKSYQRLVNWNTDVIEVTPLSASTDTYDPTYLSIPLFFTKTEQGYLGFLLDNPTKTFFNFGTVGYSNAGGSQKESRNMFYFGSYNGESSLYIIPGQSFQEVVVKASQLMGVAELPPRWSLGHHQSRWSYSSEHEVKSVVEKYEHYDIPLSSVWLDIDCMDAYKIFTWHPQYFSHVPELCQWLKERKKKLVTIIDPGVKQEKGYAIYDEGHQKKLFCQNPMGGDFVGHVWPGNTVFPDFSLVKTRTWWAGHVSSLLKTGVAGVWLDMNEPSTGFIDPEDMLFQEGTVPHEFFHNQYALLMAQATHEGFLKARPTTRPFILSRSGFTGIQKYAAVWTGDLYSTWGHLRASIRECLGLSLCGVSFCGADVGGFVGHCPEELITRWYQASFLLPFFRNHNSKSVLDGDPEFNQEPYVYTEKTRERIRRVIAMRYSLLPYIYNLFHHHTKTYEPVVRPMMYEFDEDQFVSVYDQYMVGNAILHAPILDNTNERAILFPNGFWYDGENNTWIEGGSEKQVHISIDSTGLYIRDGSIIPRMVGKKLVFSCYMHSVTTARYKYYEDDGETTQNKQGEYSEYDISVTMKNGTAEISVTTIHDGYHPRNVFEFVVTGEHDYFPNIIVQSKKNGGKTGRGSR